MSDVAEGGLTRSRPACALLPVVVVLTAVMVGCASAPAANGGPAPSERLDRSVRALHEGAYRTATLNLLSVRDECRGHPLGDRALLLWAATKLDPRNPDRRLDEVARAAALHLVRTGESSWTRPVAEALYLLALERGASVPDSVMSATLDSIDAEAPPTSDATPQLLSGRDSLAGRCRPAPESEAPTAPTSARVRLPELPGQPYTARIIELEDRTEELEVTTTRLRQIIAELEQELERIRETLRP